MAAEFLKKFVIRILIGISNGNSVRKSSWLDQLCAFDLELEQKAQMTNFSCRQNQMAAEFLKKFEIRILIEIFNGNSVRKSSWLHQLCAFDLEPERKASFDEGLKVVKGHLNPGLFNPKLRPRTIQPQTFQP